MIELQPLTVSEYFNLEDKSEYYFAMKYAFRFTNPVDEYKIGDVMEMPFGFVKDFQYEIEQNSITLEKLINFALEATGRKTFKEEQLDKLCRFISYLQDSIENIIKIESIKLAYEPTEKEITAGLDRFDGLGVYMQIRQLTGGDVTKYDAVRKLPYSLCFTELYTSKQLYEYNRALNPPPKK